MSYDYWDITSGEGLDEDTLLERYDEMLDEVHDNVVIWGTMTYPVSQVLKAVDPIAYRVGYNDWLDNELGETITEDEPDDEEEVN